MRMNDFCVSLPLKNGESLCINCLDRSIIATDNENGLKGDSDENDGRQFSYDDFIKWFNRVVYDCTEIKAIVMLTTRCNLACTYCFQDGYVKESQSDLTVETAEKIISWIQAFAETNQSRTVHLYLYGGEPSLNHRLVSYFAKKGKSRLEEASLNVVGHMFTNGVHFNENVFDAIESGFIKFLQITIDGAQPVHDRRRPFKNGKGTFNDIIKNIHRLINQSDAEITILSNFDSENINSINELYNYFAETGLTDKKDKLFFTFNPVFKTPYNCHHCSSFSLSNTDLYKKWSNLLFTTHTSGIPCNPLPIFEKGPCSFWRKSHFVFDTKGDIYKCIGMPGMKNFSIGNVTSYLPEVIQELPAKMISSFVWENSTCNQCPYLPLCLGGCRFHAIVEYNDVTMPYCHKDLIEKCEFETIKMMYGDIQI